MPKQIVILTTGQPSTNPRMVKEYLALKEAGYLVKVFYSYWHHWAVEPDKQFFTQPGIDKQDFEMVGGSPFENKMAYTISKIKQKINQFIYFKTGMLRDAAKSRTTPHLIAAAKNYKADLYIAHNAGALPAAVQGAAKHNAKAGFDAEDLHRGEYKNKQSRHCHHLVAVEDAYLPRCHFVTVASPLIGASYKKLYPGQGFVTINNVFSKKYLQKLKETEDGQLSLFWFSQTIGPHRGLSSVVRALNLLKPDCNVHLYLLGNIAHGYDKKLLKLSHRENVHFLPPVQPDAVFAIAAKYDIGLSIEVPDFENRNVCLTNKIFTYLLAGNCILFSDTDAQTDFLQTYPGAGFLFENGNEYKLATAIEKLFYNREQLNIVKQYVSNLSATKLNWENESKKLVTLINSILQN